MQTRSVKVEWPVSPRLADDIIVTAFDPGYGGCLYWAVVDKYHPAGQWATTDKADRAVDFHSDGEGGGTVEHMDYNRIAAGLQLAVEKGHQEIIQAVIDDDGGIIDATLADVIVQYATFGKLVYG